MVFGCLLLYVTAIYVRPAEIVPAWAGVPFVDILTAISIAAMVLSLLVRPRPIADLPQDKLLVAFWALIAISSTQIWIWWVYASTLEFVPSIVCYFLIRLGVKSERQLKVFAYLLIALNVFLAVNGIVQYHTGIGLGNVQMNFGRIYGTGIFNDPNDLGLTFVMSIPFIVLVMALPRTFIGFRLLAIPALATILLAIYYTNSRGALVGLGAVVVCYAFLRLRPLTATFAASILIVIIAAAAPSRASEMTFEESSAQSRIHSWAEGWAMLKSSPLIGVGYGQYMEHHERVAHNSFVHTFAELGLLGAFCIVGMFYWYFKSVSMMAKEDATFGRWRSALIASGIGLVVCAWFLSRQYIPVLYILLGFGSSSAALSLTQQQRRQLQSTRKDFLAIGAYLFAGLLAVYLMIRTMAIWSS